MHILNRFSQYTHKLARRLLVTTWILGASCVLSCVSFAQNAPTVAEASASSAASSAPPEKPIYANNNERDNALLAKAFTAIAKADELQWLETPDEKVLSLYKAGETRKTLGLLLIMHAPEVPQLWPANLENIRRNLPLYSWATVALPLPTKYPVTIPARESSVAASTAESAAASSAAAAELASAAASSEPAKPVVARDKLISGRVDAALEQINKLGKLDLAVLVDNSSAPDALAAIYAKYSISNANLAEGPLKAVILVNLQDQEPFTKEQLTAIFSAGNLRVMDVFFNPDNKTQSELRRQHQAEAMRQNVRDYQQVILQNQPVPSIDDTQSFWLGKIHGFLMRKSSSSQSSSRSSASSN